MNTNFDEIELEKNRLKNLKNELIIHYHQDATFYERRTYIAFFLISGVGLYACSDLYNKIESIDLLNSLSILAGFFIVPILLSVISNEFARKKSMEKAEWYQKGNEIYRKGARKYTKLENGFKIAIGSLYLLGSIGVGILYYLSF
ncbi:hypothetical protein [Christiangramia crocea]|uniref:Uncharacterized protein n=1 Tax=Christiangramia crocea TaxID=2904124 RepID=A0A9X1UX73_9FLAO|nr:hypothetical protein [Gramella crocea]MCG9971164.1 hypothetical protein [Gramella crocea]